ncbi:MULTISPECIES: heme exporter protein CcmD [Bordetella]|uniref:heme exporter protein CcmD n=1 Tax=Bordetella TaxID=517 RepID=UPI0004B5C9F1|nr:MULTISPECIES: heme exporter protein CcmD [Bordetella]
MIAFSSIEDFLAMGGHGAYVWASYGIAVASLGWNAVHPLLQRRRFLRLQKRRALGEATP